MKVFDAKLFFTFFVKHDAPITLRQNINLQHMNILH